MPRLVSTPDGIPNEMFGDAAMVTEFIMCCSGLLMPDNQDCNLNPSMPSPLLRIVTKKLENRLLLFYGFVLYFKVLYIFFR